MCTAMTDLSTWKDDGGLYISATPEFLLAFTPFFSKLKAIQRFS